MILKEKRSDDCFLFQFRLSVLVIDLWHFRMSISPNKTLVLNVKFVFERVKYYTQITFFVFYLHSAKMNVADPTVTLNTRSCPPPLRVRRSPPEPLLHGRSTERS